MRKSVLALVALLALVLGISSAGPPAEMPQGSEIFAANENLGVGPAAASPASAIVVSYDLPALKEDGPAAAALVSNDDQYSGGMRGSKEVAGVLPHRVLILRT